MLERLSADRDRAANQASVQRRIRDRYRNHDKVPSLRLQCDLEAQVADVFGNTGPVIGKLNQGTVVVTGGFDFQSTVFIHSVDSVFNQVGNHAFNRSFINPY